MIASRRPPQAAGSRHARRGLFGVAVLVTFVALAASASRAPAADAFYRVPLQNLKLTAGTWPGPGQPNTGPDPRGGHLREPWARVANGGEAYVELPQLRWDAWRWHGTGREGSALVVRAAAGADVTGVLVVPNTDASGMVPLSFAVPRAAATDDARTAFYRVKYAHYERLLGTGRPGAAWFRHEARAAEAALGPFEAGRVLADALPAGRPAGSLDDTYTLFTGGRALSENLQLDRVLPAGRRAGELTVPLASVRGVATKEMDWGPLVKDKRPATDPLAARIPIDQHAVFFPSFAAMRDLVDDADAQGVPVLQALEPRAEDARTKERYQRQLCLSMTGLGRLVGPRLIGGVAVTGSDAYLRVGSDVAVLFEAKDPAVLHATLKAQLEMARQANPSAEPVAGRAGSLDYVGLRSPDRGVCSYVARLGDSDVLVVTNSPAQLERLAAVRDGAVGSVAAAPEYTFFRDRYARGGGGGGGEGGESAFVVLTDATIRRWCSARWRILDSRRTVAAAVLAELQAKHADRLAAGRRVEPAPVTSDRYLPGMGDLRLTPAGVASSTYGSLAFMTPIVELEAGTVTPGEAESYGRWRDGYERNWSGAFDPVALQLSIAGGRTTADLTVLPLILGTEYRPYIEVTQGVALAPNGGDRHDALLHYAMAVNRESAPFKSLAGFVKQFAPQARIDPFAWVGSSVAVYVDDDPLWREAAAAADPDRFLNENHHRLPVAAYVASDSPLKLAAFMAAVRGFLDGTAPGTAAWDTLEHNGRSYVRVSGKGAAEIDKLRIYYATTPEALVVTPNEDVLRRALDRQAARAAARAGAANGAANGANGGAAGAGVAMAGAPGANAPPATRPAAAGDRAATRAEPWLGDSVAVEVDARALAAVRGIFGRAYQDRMRELAWANLPALNEWKRLHPDHDPVEVHARLWQVRLVDPAGGQYVWDERYQTMASTTYGHPGATKDGPPLPSQLDRVVRAAMGVTFEHQGLRARAVLERDRR